MITPACLFGFGSGCLLNHTFVLRVEGVRDLSVLDSSVWGEADCFVQYHFPTLGCEEAGGEGGCAKVFPN